MSGPPDDPTDDQDPAWGDLRDQVERALAEAGLAREGLDEAVLEGVRQAFQALDELTGVASGRSAPSSGEEAGPEVHVVEGGRDDDTDLPEDRDRPDLRIAPEPEEAAGEAAPGATGGVRLQPEGDGPDVRVTVHRLGAGDTVRRATRVPDVRRRGAILVAAGEGQTLYRGQTPRLYRITCTDGALRVEVEGVPTETLRPGQAVDIEARYLRVHAEAAPSAGIYALVKQP